MENKEEKKEEETKVALKLVLERMKKLEEDNEMLLQCADNKAKARYYIRHKEDLPPIVRLRSMETFDKEGKPMGEKLIVGWRMVEDKGRYQIPGTERWTEYQMIEIIFQDGSNKKLSEEEFVRGYEKHIKAKRIGSTIDEKTKQETLRLQIIETGEEITIGSQFVN